ncbi:DUF3810 domain-containing protein [Flavobacterium sp. SUN052]|uniref:DUF3810 domain-containing protein n=1 Tax=Flavobacterium sp. SUN052 TaxID=3002441 RepID=UPI00237D741B|nr:DUF3810 domain-containing protein [Flavobacterium sp. SUN052]MEC4005704.1 DUF3810 domain-containing protein [Flavobacterium sp. SUN052]
MKRKYILPIFLVFQIIFLKVIAFFPEVVERFYSNGLYVIISKIARTLFGKIPFSVGDLIYSIAIIYILISIWKARKTLKIDWKNKLLKITNCISIFYFMFHFLWALNYYRMPLFEKMNIQREYSDEDLYLFTEKLITKSNEIQFKITHNKNLKVSNSVSQQRIFETTQNGYDNLTKVYPFFKYEIPSRKKSLFSLPLTYMGFSGYLNPFTNEAQVNSKIPKYDFPYVICHEMAHQIGYGSESECNFIGFLACTNNQDLHFQYSAYVVALHYCLSNIAMKNEAKFNYFKAKVNPGILENYKESEVFWKQYDSFIDKGFHAFYDQFLKINQQKDGIDSYSKYVNLLVNYYKNRKL